mgnify:FL=1
MIFDLDDTLYSKNEVFFKTFCQFATPTIDAESLYLTYQKRSDEAFEKFSSGEITLSQSHLNRVYNTFKDVGIELTSEKIQAFIKAYKDNLNSITLSKEWIEVFQQCNKESYQIAILTNGPTDHQKDKLYQLNLSKWIPEDFWFISESIQVKKPSIQAFHHVESNISADEYFMIGDDIHTDIKGAIQANWHPIQFTKYHQMDAGNYSCDVAKEPKDIFPLIQQILHR